MEFKAKSSGAKVVINDADFEDVMALKSAIFNEISKSDFSVKFDSKRGLFEQDLDIASIAKLALLVDSSPTVNACLMKCLLRCTYNSEKITKETFNPKAARADYYEIVTSCLKENLSPFFSNLGSLFQGIMGSLTQKPDAHE